MIRRGRPVQARSPKYASSARMYGTHGRACLTASRAASSDSPSRTMNDMGLRWQNPRNRALIDAVYACL